MLRYPDISPDMRVDFLGPKCIIPEAERNDNVLRIIP